MNVKNRDDVRGDYDSKIQLTLKQPHFATASFILMTGLICFAIVEQKIPRVYIDKESIIIDSPN